MTNRSTISRRVLLGMAALLALPLPCLAAAQTFDSHHGAWTTLLKKHVVVLDGGKASQLRYAGMAADRPALKAYLATLSSVSQATFDAWPKPQQMAFLINAYNAYTVELILTRYPKLVSIKDLGSVIQSPWKQKFIPLLGSTVSLDHIEQDLLRERGRFDDPRIHFAVNCASIGCPPLREEAFVAEQLDLQLDQQAQRFLSDRSRNRWNPTSEKLEVSKIFDWYKDDFRQGYRGIGSVAAYLARFSEQLADAPSDRERVNSQRASVVYLDYDWNLNDAR